jgi:hypothetical protein
MSEGLSDLRFLPFFLSSHESIHWTSHTRENIGNLEVFNSFSNGNGMLSSFVNINRSYSLLPPGVIPSSLLRKGSVYSFQTT